MADEVKTITWTLNPGRKKLILAYLQMMDPQVADLLRSPDYPVKIQVILPADKAQKVYDRLQPKLGGLTIG